MNNLVGSFEPVEVEYDLDGSFKPVEVLGIEILLLKAFVFSSRRPCTQGLETIYDVLMMSEENHVREKQK